MLVAAACGGRAHEGELDGGRDAGEDAEAASDAAPDAGADAGSEPPPCRRNEDTVGDGIDQNCDGLDGVDRDGDGFASMDSGGDDCDDGRDDVNPGAAEVPGGGLVSAIVDQGPSIWLHDVARRADGSLQVLYYGSGDTTIARLGDAGWSFESLGIGWMRVGQIAPDSSLHFAYECTAGLCYATTATGLWVEEAVDSALSGSPWPVCMDFDAASEPVIAYIDRGDGISTLRALAARRSDGGEWSVEEVASGVNGQLACAVDPWGTLHVMYKLLGVDAPVMYATDSSGRWESSSTAVTTPGDWGVLAVGPEGSPHIVVSWGALEYRTIMDGPWVAEAVPGGSVAEDVAVAPDGAIHELGLDVGTLAYTYAVRRDGEWGSQPIIEILSGRDPYLMVDRDVEVIDVFHFEDPADPGCLECGYITQLRYTGPGPFDEDCDGVAE